jgi:DNA repair protein RadC
MSKRQRGADPSLFDPEAAADPKGSVNLFAQHRERLRSRFLAADAESFADYELLELLLFYSVDRVDVKPLAKQLLHDFGSLGGVLAAAPERLRKYPRIGDRTVVHFRAIREAMRRLLYAEVVDRPVVSSWQQLLDYCRATLADEQTERFRVLFLDRKNKLIRDEIQQKGTVDHTPVYPREVIKRALELGASALILVHNHPSGDPAPSRTDIEMTREVRDAGEKLGICLYDHIVVGRREARSFKAMGLL